MSKQRKGSLGANATSLPIFVSVVQDGISADVCEVFNIYAQINEVRNGYGTAITNKCATL